jgi:hypothetical protein
MPRMAAAISTPMLTMIFSKKRVYGKGNSENEKSEGLIVQRAQTISYRPNYEPGGRGRRKYAKAAAPCIC